MTGTVPDSANDKRLGPIIPVEELLSRLSTEFRNAELLPALQRAKVRVRLATEMRELHEVLVTERAIKALKTDEFKKEHPEVYRQLFG